MGTENASVLKTMIEMNTAAVRTETAEENTVANPAERETGTASVTEMIIVSFLSR